MEQFGTSFTTTMHPYLFSTTLAGNAEQLLLDKLLAQLREKKLLKGHKRQRTDSTYVLGAIRNLNRLETLGETFRAALNSLTVVAPDWLQEHL